jgi:hypothetical protein
MTTTFGLLRTSDLYNQRVMTVGVQRVYDAVRSHVEEYTRVLVAMAAELAERTTIPQEQIELPGDGTLQPLDEDGNPLPVLPSGNYQVAYPIQGGGTAWGTNRVSRELMTVEEAERNTLDAERRDADWMIRHILAAIFDNVAWTYLDKVGANGSKGLGPITIQPLANGDAVTYVRKGAAASATDDHYLAQASAIDDTHNPFPTIEAELSEHPSNGNRRILVYIPNNLKDSIMGLETFVGVSDPNVSDPNSAVATNVPNPGFGDEVLGYIKGTKCWIVLWGFLSDNFMFAKVEGKAFLKMREYPAAALQGFFPENANVDGNHLITRMIRYAGFAVADRVAACVMRIGNASYAIPSGFDAPLAV